MLFSALLRLCGSIDFNSLSSSIRPTTFLTDAYPPDKTPTFTLFPPEGPATTSVAERKEEAPREDIAATLLYSYSWIKLLLEPSFKIIILILHITYD